MVLLVVTFPGCAALRARQDYERLVQHAREINEPWAAARARLLAMCFANAAECADRTIKLTNSGRLDDWYWMRLPPYRTIVAVHDYHVLARGTTYRELGGDYYDRRHTQRLTRRAIRLLEGQGYRVTLEPAA